MWRVQAGTRSAAAAAPADPRRLARKADGPGASRVARGSSPSREGLCQKVSFIVGPGWTAAKVAGLLVAWSPTLRVIAAADLARAFVRALPRSEAVDGKILEGRSLWQLVA